MSNSSNPPSFSASGEEGMSHHQAPQQQQQQQVPSTPQIRTSKELELSFLNHGRMDSSGRGGGGSSISPSTSSCTPTILYSHANAEDLGNIYPWCKFLSKMLGVNIMAYDYTGYGLATDQGEFVFALLFCFWIGLRVWDGEGRLQWKFLWNSCVFS